MRYELTEFAKSIDENAWSRFNYHRDRWLLNHELRDNKQLIAGLEDIKEDQHVQD
jgi:hypothetical protein